MPQVKRFENMNLLEQIESSVKKLLPKDSQLNQESVKVSYLLSMNVTTENNPFSVTTKDYTVEAIYFDSKINVTIKDGEKIIKQETIINS